MSKAITKILGANRKASPAAEPVMDGAVAREKARRSGAGALDQKIVDNIPFAASARDVGRFLSMADVEMADVSLHTAYVEKIREAKDKEAAAAVANYETDPKHEFLRQLVAEYAELKAEVQYVREELHGVPLSHSRSKSVDPVAFMGVLKREGDQEALNEYRLDMKNDFVGGIGMMPRGLTVTTGAGQGRRILRRLYCPASVAGFYALPFSSVVCTKTLAMILA